MKDEPFLLKIFHECPKEEQIKICKEFEQALEKDKMEEAKEMPIKNPQCMTETLTVEKLYKMLKTLVKNGHGDLPISINGCPIMSVDLEKDLESLIGIDIKIPAHYCV